MTALTLFDLVIRSMRKNIKHYYLYFFALILSVVLYFVFATLQYDEAVSAGSGKLDEDAVGISGSRYTFWLFIAGIFVVYANAIFLKRRSREIGLYQLIGLSKSKVARLLIIENILLSTGALIIGIGAGLLVSRLFLLLLVKLIGYKGFHHSYHFHSWQLFKQSSYSWRLLRDIHTNVVDCSSKYAPRLIQCR